MTRNMVNALINLPYFTACTDRVFILALRLSSRLSSLLLGNFYIGFLLQKITCFTSSWKVRVSSCFTIWQLLPYKNQNLVKRFLLPVTHPKNFNHTLIYFSEHATSKRNERSCEYIQWKGQRKKWQVKTFPLYFKLWPYK